MGHAYVLLAVLLTVGVMSLNGAHSLLCSPDTPIGNVVEISQEQCMNHTVMYTWMASERIEIEIEINCSNETHETGSIQSYELTSSLGGDVTTQVSPELEGNVQCEIRGCYEDIHDYSDRSVSPVTVSCAPTEDEQPSPTPSPSPPPSPSSSPSSPPTLNPTPSPLHTIQPTQDSSTLGLILTSSLVVAALVVLIIIAIVAILIVTFIKGAQGKPGGRKYFPRVNDFDLKVDIHHEFKNLQGPYYQSTSTIFELIEETLAEYTEVAKEKDQMMSEEVPNSSDKPEVHSEDTPDEKRNVSSQSHTTSIAMDEQIQPTGSHPSSAYVTDTRVDSGGSGPAVSTFDVDIKAITADISSEIDINIPENSGSPLPIAESSELAGAMGNSTCTTVIPDTGTRDSKDNHSHGEDLFYSDTQPDSTELCANHSTDTVLDDDILEGVRESVGGSAYSASCSGNSTNTSGTGYISLPSSDQYGTED